MILSHELYKTITPLKSLGQNFIFNPHILRKISQFPKDLDKKIVIEVGAGMGTLTQSLLEEGAHYVIAIEKDERCIPFLIKLQEQFPDRLQICHGDALKLKLGTLYTRDDFSPQIIIANLPYYISVPLTLKWLQEEQKIQEFFLMFQKEVANRLMASPGSKFYGRLSVMAQWKCKIINLLELSPKNFKPQPKIFSTLLHLIPHSSLQEVSWKKMEYITEESFQTRRKMLRTSLKRVWGDPHQILTEIGIDSTRRPETLTIKEFIKLAQKV